MTQHPQIEVPDVGPLDHAWELVGAWAVTVRRGELGPAAQGTLTWESWECGLLVLAGGTDVEPAVPEVLTRVSQVQRAPTGGGALTFLVEGPRLGPLLVTVWPGELQLIGAADEAGRLAVTGRREAEYYRRKYPLAPA